MIGHAAILFIVLPLAVAWLAGASAYFPPYPAPKTNPESGPQFEAEVRMSSGPLIVVAVLLVLTFVVTVVIARSELARSGAKFLQQCRYAGFDAAECRLIEATTHT